MADTRIKKLPVGIENFAEIRTEGFYYVDKTSMIRDLLNKWSKVNLITRPRRFGKSLNMSMLKTFLEIGCDKTLFNGLAISEDTALRFYFLLDSARLTDQEKKMYRKMIHVSSDAPDNFEMSEDVLTGSLRTLSELLQKHYAGKVILLV